MTTRPNEDDYQRIVWGQPEQRPPETLSSPDLAARCTYAASVLTDYQQAAPTEDTAGRAMWGARLADAVQLLLAAVPVTPASGPQAASGQLEAASGPPGPSPADRAWTCRWCGRHHAGVHGDRSPWPDQDTFVMVSRDVRQWLPVAAYPAEAVYTVRDRYAMMLAEIMAYGWPEDPAILRAFRLADAWCMCLPTRSRRWWKCRDGSYG